MKKLVSCCLLGGVLMAMASGASAGCADNSDSWENSGYEQYTCNTTSDTNKGQSGKAKTAAVCTKIPGTDRDHPSYLLSYNVTMYPGGRHQTCTKQATFMPSCDSDGVCCVAVYKILKANKYIGC